MAWSRQELRAGPTRRSRLELRARVRTGEQVKADGGAGAAQGGGRRKMMMSKASRNEGACAWNADVERVMLGKDAYGRRKYG